jgi:hypothetical protein
VNMRPAESPACLLYGSALGEIAEYAESGRRSYEAAGLRTTDDGTTGLRDAEEAESRNHEGVGAGSPKSSTNQTQKLTAARTKQFSSATRFT